MKTRLYGARYAFDMDVLYSGNGIDAKLIRLNRTMNSVGTIRGSDSER
jgi:hypothetical protein